jgi:hypothetical protein
MGFGNRFGAGIVFAMLVFGNITATQAAVIFEANFDGLASGTDIAPAGFTEPTGTGNANYSLNGSGMTFNASATTTNTTGVASNKSAAINLPGMASNIDPFTISTNYTLDSFVGGAASTINFGLTLFGSDPNFSTGTNYRVLFTPFAAAGTSTRRLSISEFGSSTGTTAPQVISTEQVPSATLVDGMTGTLTVTGYYSLTGALNLEATFTAGSTTLTSGLFTDPTPLTGSLFGYRSALNAQGNTGGNGATASLNVTYDNYSVTTNPVPEPGTMALTICMSVFVSWGLYRRR